jgi:hypothetical protein
MEEKKKFPFSKSFVMKTTLRHIEKAINISIDKTFARMPEFEENSHDAREILEALSGLHRLRKDIEDYKLENPSLFRDK